jgi:ketosteroid isomerase-like protein
VSQETNIEAVRRGIDAFNRRDFDAALEMLRDDVTWERFLSRAESDDQVIHGKKELRAIWESQVETVDIRVEPEKLIPAGDDKVIAPTAMVGRGRESEINLSASLTWVWTFDERGLIAGRSRRQRGGRP